MQKKLSGTILESHCLFCLVAAWEQSFLKQGQMRCVITDSAIVNRLKFLNERVKKNQRKLCDFARISRVNKGIGSEKKAKRKENENRKIYRSLHFNVRSIQTTFWRTEEMESIIFICIHCIPYLKEVVYCLPLHALISDKNARSFWFFSFLQEILRRRVWVNAVLHTCSALWLLPFFSPLMTQANFRKKYLLQRCLQKLCFLMASQENLGPGLVANARPLILYRSQCAHQPTGGPSPSV